MDPALCREHLAELLGEEIVLLTELQQLLEEERGSISRPSLRRCSARLGPARIVWALWPGSKSSGAR